MGAHVSLLSPLPIYAAICNPNPTKPHALRYIALLIHSA